LVHYDTNTPAHFAIQGAIMSTVSANIEPKKGVASPSHKLIARAGMSWFVAASVGQSLFLAYILGFYTPSAVSGHFERWSQHRQVIDGYVAGDLVGNIQFGAHILMAAILTFGGMAQLWPSLRKRFASFHRWNGRVFASAAILASLGGLWLVWVRGSRIDLTSAVGISVNAILIILFIVMTVKCARERNFVAHQKWAMRAFLAVSGVWFLRIGMMAFGLISSGALGAPPSYTEGFFPIWSFGCYLVPLVMYEAYAWAKAKGGVLVQSSMSAVLFVLTAIAGVGILGSSLVMWLPPVRAVWGI
jgi:hypothetical protein